MPGVGDIDIARNWEPLCEALQQHVRIPLLRDHEDDWKRFNPRESDFKWRVARDLARAHYLPKEASKDSVLWYTLIYSCMHCDALTSLMNADEFNKSLDFQSGNSSSVLHIDFGCGPGTAAWSVMKNLPATIHIKTIGHDHNPRMTNLATQMAQTISQSASNNGMFAFFTDWNRFHNQVMSNTNQYDTFLVTANSLFGQDSFSSNYLKQIIHLIKSMRAEAQQKLIMLCGTHPPYNPDGVEQTWHRVAEETRSVAAYNQELSVSSWSPIRCTHDIHSSWHLWQNPQPQNARILVLPPTGGKR